MSTSKRIKMACGIVIMALAASQGLANTLHVDSNDPNAFQTIQKAIDAAESLDTVVVHPGVYRETIDFKGKPITVTSIDPNDPTVVAGTVVDPDCRLCYPYVHVVTFQNREGEQSVLRGLTIRGGNRGIYCTQSDAKPQIRQCTISSNRSSGIGGGSPSIIECTITLNDETGIEGCYGVIRDCTVTRNGGSGVSFPYEWQDTTALRIHGCMIIANGGSGVFAHRCDGSTISNCVMCGNQGDGIKSDYSYLHIENCTVVGNKTRGIGNNPFGQTPTVVNSIIAYNSAAGMQSVWSEYNDLYGNGGGHASPEFTKHEMNEPPNFIDKGYWDANDVWHQGDYHLASTAGRWDPVAKAWVQDLIDSPCIDKGDPNTPVGDEPSPNGGRINLGAYGGTAQASQSADAGVSPAGPKCTEFPRMDFNHDCKVDQADLDLFMEHWLECGLDDPNACWPDLRPSRR